MVVAFTSHTPNCNLLKLIVAHKKIILCPWQELAAPPKTILSWWGSDHSLIPFSMPKYNNVVTKTILIIIKYEQTLRQSDFEEEGITFNDLSLLLLLSSQEQRMQEDYGSLMTA